jgi:hypothetical protein
MGGRLQLFSLLLSALFVQVSNLEKEKYTKAIEYANLRRAPSASVHSYWVVDGVSAAFLVEDGAIFFREQFSRVCRSIKTITS